MRRRRVGLVAPLALLLAACREPAPPPSSAPPADLPASVASPSAPVVEVATVEVPPASAAPLPETAPPLSSSATGDPGFERRCGWVDNPTPANWSIIDRDGEWVIGVQGGFQAEGDMPDFGSDWVEQNGHYGYGCACIEARVDPKTKHVLEIRRATKLALARCRTDKRLPRR